MAKPDVEYMAMFFFEEVAQASDLTTAVVFGRLYALVGSDNQQPFLNIEAMARSCNVSRYTIMRCLKDLVSMKLISRHRNGGETYRYMVHFDQLRQLVTLKKSTLKDSTYKVEDSNVQRGKFQHEERCKNPHLNSDSEKGSQMEGKSESPAPSHPTQTFLQSADEVMTKMGEWINKHRVRHPVLDSVDLPMEADGFYLKYRTKKVDLEALVDAWMRQLVTAREAKAKVVYSGKAPVMSIRDGAQKDGVELDRVFGFMDDLKQAYLEVKHDA